MPDKIVLKPDISFADALLAFGMSIEEFRDLFEEQRIRVKTQPQNNQQVISLKEIFSVFTENLYKTPVTDHKTLEQSSIDCYKQVIRDLYAYCIKETNGLFDPVEFAQLCEQYVDHRISDGEITEVTANKYIGIIRRFLKFVQFHYATPPLLLPKRKKDYDLLPQALTMQQIRELFKIAGGSDYPVRNLFMIRFLLATGLRRNEFRLVQRRDVSLDYNSPQVTVVHAKGGRERVVPFPPQLIPSFLDYFHIYDISRPTDYIFGASGDPAISVTNSSIDQRFKRLVTKHSCYSKDNHTYKFRLHCLRHTYATLLLRKRVSLRNISKLLGHASMRSTSIYTVLDTEALREDAAPGLNYIGDILTGRNEG